MAIEKIAEASKVLIMTSFLEGRTLADSREVTNFGLDFSIIA